MVSEELQQAIAIESLGFACPQCNAKISAKCVDHQGSHPGRMELAVRLVVKTFPPTAELLPTFTESSPSPEVSQAAVNAVPAPITECKCNHKYAHHCCQSKWGPPATSIYNGPCQCPLLCHRRKPSDGVG